MRLLTQTLLDTGLSNAAVACLLALVAAVVTRVCRRPALAYALWLLVLLKFVSPAVIALTVSNANVANDTAQASVPASSAHFQRSPSDNPGVSTRPVAQEIELAKQHPTLNETTDDSEAVTSALAIEERSERPIAGTTVRVIKSAAPYALATWGCGTFLYFLLLASRIRQFRHVLHKTTIAPYELQSEATRLAKVLGIRRAPEVRIVDATIPPFLFAARFRPVIVLPRQLLERLGREERQMVLAHELAHLKRKDHYLLWLELVVVGLYWWQPVAWLARRRLQRAAEQCCDAFVIRNFPRQARDYAAALLKTVEFLDSAPPVRPGLGLAFARSGPMQRRFEMILRPTANDHLPRGMILVVILLGIVALPMSIHSLWAGGSPSEDAKQATPVEQGTGGAALPQSPVGDGQVDIDRRLQRLENMIEALTDEIKSRRPKDSEEILKQDLHRARDRAVAHEEYLDHINQFASALRDIKRRIAVFESSMNRRAAAQTNVDAIKATYLGGDASLDLLLDAQRRLVDSEITSVQHALELADLQPKVRDQMLAVVTLDVSIRGRDAALQTFRHVEELRASNSKGGDMEKQAQAREQYFFFRDQVEKALSSLYGTQEPTNVGGPKN